MYSIDYTRKIAEVYFPEGEDLTNMRVGNFIIEQMRSRKPALKELAVVAQRVLDERITLHCNSAQTPPDSYFEELIK